MYQLGVFVEGASEARYDLGVVIKDSDNLVPAFQSISRMFWRAEKEQFDSYGLRGGAEWLPLSYRYAKWKHKHYPGRPLMVLTGELRRSLTGKSAKSYLYYDRHKMAIGTTVSYAPYHQSGTRKMPRRPLIALTKDDAMDYAKEIQKHVMKGLTKQERIARKVFL